MSFLALADLEDAPTLLRAVDRHLRGIVTTTNNEGDAFLFYDPDGTTVPERRFPFCTLVTGDRYDGASWLDRDPTTYRVNLEVSRASYESRFGRTPRQAAGRGVIETGYDYAATDAALPHPFYAPLHWVCVVNPGARTRSELSDLLVESHGLAKRRYDNRRMQS